MTWGLGMVYYAHSKSMKQNFTRLNLPLLESDDLLAHLLGVATCIYIYIRIYYSYHVRCRHPYMDTYSNYLENMWYCNNEYAHSWAF